jgi:hypothetical protein
VGGGSLWVWMRVGSSRVESMGQLSVLEFAEERTEERFIDGVRLF